MSLLAPNIPKKRQYTEKQEKFLQLFSETMNVQQAFEGAGYQGTQNHWLVESLSEEIVAIANNYLAVHAPKAAKQVVEVLSGDAQREKDWFPSQYKAAIEVLDRVGIGKQSHMTVTGEVLHGVVLLPSKQEMGEVIDVQAED